MKNFSNMDNNKIYLDTKLDKLYSNFSNYNNKDNDYLFIFTPLKL